MSSGSFGRCTKNASEDFNYCKLHLKKELHKQLYQSKEQKHQQCVIEEINASVVAPSLGLQKKFIQDSFYYIDSAFIYAIDDRRRVGIIENQEYILTDDPFVLGLI